ncbi:DGQHR domain-containing protein [Metabacillus fastidiosus]|uniref:DGQHR domain-containing protein n=1 Tax=Metabacillus fastidiosus TaxID=1458 RepID=UPI002E1CD8B7|nr:DGQHR domain-containing protein [Metabacillus fastidiosus]
MNREAFLYTQNNQLYISSVLEFREINAIAKPLIYGENPLGYQRKLDKKHYYELARKLVKGDVLLPTSIILGVDREFLSQYMYLEEIDEVKSCQIPIDKLITYAEKRFSVVDGQHRLAALELAVSKREELISYKLNVIILVNDKINRNKEIKVFTDINSKAKKITTDLTLLAEHNYRLHYNIEELTEKDIIDHIGVKIAYNLNEWNTKNNVWLRAIKLDVASDDNYGIIGVAAFKSSLNKLISTYIHPSSNMLKIHEFDIYKINSIAEDLTNLLLKVWNLILNRWPSAFDFSENNQPYYNPGYYLQKTTGVNALHLILENSLEESHDNEEILIKFHGILSQSLVEAKDWKVKGKFAGLTSKSGFNKAIRIILNQES